jgi:transketolase
VQRVDGNDLPAVAAAFDRARALKEARPRVVLFDTLMGKGVPFLEEREKNHFMRVEPPEWQHALDVLDRNCPWRDRRSRLVSAATGKERLTTSAMIASIASEGQRTRNAPFGKALVEYAARRPEVVGLTADLAKYTDLHVFAQAYPDRFLPDGDGRAAADGRGRRIRQGRPGAVRDAPTRCSPRGAPTTSSTRSSPRRT